MGITIHYHGKITDLDRVEEFEDRVVDMALEIGAAVRIWRSSSDHDASRSVRGLILDVSPGQEPTSLLISPEGWLIPLHAIEAAETGTLAEPPHCFVKTQFGSVEGHIAVVALLSFLKQEFFPTLHVSDESGYWEDRDVDRFVEKFTSLRATIDMLSEGLRNSPLSAEAAEDPAIVAKRVERIARQVHQSLARPPEHPRYISTTMPHRHADARRGRNRRRAGSGLGGIDWRSEVKRSCHCLAALGQAVRTRMYFSSSFRPIRIARAPRKSMPSWIDSLSALLVPERTSSGTSR